MDRRLALKQLALITGGLIMAPSCSFSSEKASAALTNLNISSADETLLTEIVGAIIPTTEIPGAKDLNIHQFVLVMIDDCRAKADQDAFVKGLKQFDPFIKRKYGKSFIKCSPSEREEMLQNIHTQSVSNEIQGTDVNEISAFLSPTRQLTIQGYMSSKFIMTEVFPYELVPGRFEGCTPVDLAKTIE